MTDTAADPLLGQLQLGPDVYLVNVADLPDGIRRRLNAQPGDHTVTRLQGRIPSKLIDANTARLLGQFRTAQSVVSAIIQIAGDAGLDPDAVLEAALPVLADALRSGILVPGSRESVEIKPLFQVGEQFQSYRIKQCVRCLDDTEVYLAETGDSRLVSIKIAGKMVFPQVVNMLTRETRILEKLDGTVSPRLLAQGQHEGRPFLIMDWLPGLTVGHCVALIDRDRQDGRREIARLTIAILRSYERLHRHGIVHGDVQPENMIVAPDGQVRLIDFGLSDCVDAPLSDSPPQRGAVGFFYEPELAAAMLFGGALPAPSFRGEQYRLGALIYMLITGKEYIDFSSEIPEMLRQVVTARPLPFSSFGMAAWPEMESCLGRAMDKDAGRRFESVGEFANCLEGAVASPGLSQKWTDAILFERPQAIGADFVQNVIAELSPRGTLGARGLPDPPYSSVTYGAAGIAYALHRLASEDADASLLALADLWINRALAESHKPDAFYAPQLELAPENIGDTTPYHTASGVYVVRAIICHALGDSAGRSAAITAFLQASQQPEKRLDVTLGLSGTLLAHALLLDLALSGDVAERARLLSSGNAVFNDLWNRLVELGTMAHNSTVTLLGQAHGWAGFLYAALLWCTTARIDPPAALPERLQELAGYAVPVNTGLQWPWMLDRPASLPLLSMPGWCNGSAGYVFLWARAHKHYAQDRFLSLAEGAATDAWKARPNVLGLCCGLAGRAYSLLAMYRLTGDSRWVDRARELGDIALRQFQAGGAEKEMKRYDLYKGVVGLALLLHDLSHPDTARMPFFEPEDWTGGEPV